MCECVCAKAGEGILSKFGKRAGIHCKALGDGQWVDAMGPGQCVEPGDRRVFVFCIAYSVRQPVEQADPVGAAFELDALIGTPRRKVDTGRFHDQFLRRLPPNRPGTLYKAGCEEDGVRNGLTPENRGGEARIVPIAVVQCEAHVTTRVRRVGKSLWKLFECDRYQPLFAGDPDGLLEEGRRYAQPGIGNPAGRAFRIDVMQSENDTALRIGQWQAGPQGESSPPPGQRGSARIGRTFLEPEVRA